MATKAKKFFSCQSCGHRSVQWLGRCPGCGAWNQMVEETIEPEPSRSARAFAPGSERPLRLREISADREIRWLTGISELDRVLGGGVVAGGVVLLGGDPGIGKSTLMLAALAKLAHHGTALYVTGEESLRQTRMRAERLGIDSDDLLLLAENDADKVLKLASELRPNALAIDSIQTLCLPELGSAPGTMGQVREISGRLVAFAKQTETPTFIVGHVTKDGAIAGPRLLEHMVDTVLYFEGDRGHPYRVLRAHKNRFGSTNEIGVFEMKACGLSAVLDPSALFLSERPTDAAGSVVTASISGTRPLLVEIQALVAPTGYGTARRTTMGVDHNRVALLAAVLEKKEGVDLVGCDLFVNVAGGIELSEPSSDLAIIAALVSSVRDRPLDAQTLVLGEVGLAGEVRAVAQIEPRLVEAAKMGFQRAILPAPCVRGIESPPLKLIPVSTVGEALSAFFE